MPGSKTCFRCGAVLDSQEVGSNIRPPRAPTWKKPFRFILRLIKKRSCQQTVNINFITTKLLNNASFPRTIGYLLLSFLPGLAHAVQHRFSTIRWFFITWLSLIGVAVFFYGSSIGMLLLGLATGLHAWIAADGAMLIKLDLKFKHRALGLFLASLYILAIYSGIGSLLSRNITGGFTALTIPYQNIYTGDYLLARRSAENEGLPRGSLVLVSARSIGRRNAGANVVGEIIGLPGEIIEIRNNCFKVKETALDSDIYPVPEWLADKTFTITLPDKNYFVALEYRVYRQNIDLTENMISQTCVVHEKDIIARAFMKWLPIARRGWLKETE